MAAKDLPVELVALVLAKTLEGKEDYLTAILISKATTEALFALRPSIYASLYEPSRSAFHSDGDCFFCEDDEHIYIVNGRMSISKEKRKKKKGSQQPQDDKEDSEPVARETLTDAELRDLFKAQVCAQQLESTLDGSDFIGDESWIFKRLGYVNMESFTFLGSSVRDAFIELFKHKGKPEGNADVSESGGINEFINAFKGDDDDEEEEEEEEEEEKEEKDDDDDEEEDEESAKEPKKKKARVDEEGAGKKDEKKPKVSKKEAALQELKKSLEQLPFEIHFAEGNGDNCDMLVDFLYVKAGAALGVVFFYRQW